MFAMTFFGRFQNCVAGLGLLGWVCVLTVGLAQQAEEGLPMSEEHRTLVLEGKVGEKAAVKALLRLEPGDDGGVMVNGSYHYASQGYAIACWGRLEGDRLTLEEFGGTEAMEPTGTFAGIWLKDEKDVLGPVRMRGTWTAADGKRKLPFELTEVRGDGVAEIDFYFFEETYSRKRGSSRMERSQSLLLPQLRGEEEAVMKVNRCLRRLAMLWLKSGGEAPEGGQEEPVPTLEEVERAVKAMVPDEKEMEELEVSSFESLTFDEAIEVCLNRRGVISLRLLHSEYTGGAHPNSGAQHVTFDVETGEELTVDDVLKPGWRDAVTELAEAALRRAYGLKAGDSLDEKGPLFEDRFELNDNWHLTPEGLGFSFDPYEIGPYAAGFINPVVRYADLKEWVREGSALERLLKP